MGRSQIFLALIAIPLVAGGFMLFAPEYQKDKVAGVFTYFSNERQCFNFHKKRFKDPYSAYLESGYTIKMQEYKRYMGSDYDPAYDGYSDVIVVKVRAKNAFGAYIANHFNCPAQNGKFDDTSAIVVESLKLVNELKGLNADGKDMAKPAPAVPLQPDNHPATTITPEEYKEIMEREQQILHPKLPPGWN